uniref:SWIM-type domain-containing protein n=1 Tax=Brassica oleracea var. oleracea TaxID=109376 RepID=A0A0D2ZZI7_BRAOL
MTRNYNRSKMAKDLKTRFTQKTHKELDMVEKKSKECSLRWAIGPETEVEDKDQSYVVNLENETCACRSWQMNGIPCIHAAKVILGVRRKLSEFVALCYTTSKWRETYSFGIRPVNGMIEWRRTNRLGVIPPPNRNGKP